MPKLQDLIDIMARLRDPESGCPWDKEQSFDTIAPYTLEEAYEVVDAIDRNDYEALKDELGDLLLQVVYHAQMASELGLFNFDDVVGSICDKLLRRHPHVFGDAPDSSRETLNRRWEEDKKKRRLEKGHDSAMDGIAGNLPPLRLAHKLQSRAGYYGFDWDNSREVIAKVFEETEELQHALDGDGDASEEIGDLLFTVVNLSRHLSVDSDSALRQANRKFETRFRKLETKLADKGHSLEDATAEQMQQAWEEVKSEHSVAAKPDRSRAL